MSLPVRMPRPGSARPGEAAPEAGKRVPGRVAEREEEAEAERKKASRGGKPEKRPAARRTERDAAVPKRLDRLVIGGDAELVERRGPASRRCVGSASASGARRCGTLEPIVREVVLPETITVQELANRMAVRGAEVVKQLMKMGVMATINQVLDPDTAELLVAEFGHQAKRVSEADVEIGLEGDRGRRGEPACRGRRSSPSWATSTTARPRCSTRLRATDVAAREAGGITQHIGAYQVDIGTGRPVTFIDTPGHAAFTEMRARGAKVTDIVVLVVAADDGVMPQTVEAIAHAKAAERADRRRDQQDRPARRQPGPGQAGAAQPRAWCSRSSAATCWRAGESRAKRTNLDKLIETIQLQAEMLELRANPDREAQGTVIEARLDRGRGVVATVLIQRGTLKVGDIVVGGAQWGRVRALVDDRGRRGRGGGPGDAGRDPGPGRRARAGRPARRWSTTSAGRARSPSTGSASGATRRRSRRRVRAARSRTCSRSSRSARRASCRSSSSPTCTARWRRSSAGLERISTDEVKVRILHGGVGAITESDVTLAAASKAAIIGFNVRANAQAREMAKRDGVEIRYHSIIYELLDEVKAALSGMLTPEARETILGHAEIREMFTIPRSARSPAAG